LDFKPDEYIKVRTVEEVANLLQEHGEEAAIVAGGTELHELAARGMIPRVKKLIDIERLDLDYIEDREEGIKIGAATTLRHIRDYPLFKKDGPYTALNEATKTLPAQILGLGTIGGNLCAGLPILNFPSVISMLDAELKVFSAEGENSIPANEFFIDYFLTALQPNEFVTEIHIPRLPELTCSVFHAFKILTVDFPTVSVALRVTLACNEICEDARIVCGSVGRIPFRAKNAENVLNGKRLKEKVIKRAAETVPGEIEPISDLRASAEYRKELSKVLTEQALITAKERVMR